MQNPNTTERPAPNMRPTASVGALCTVCPIVGRDSDGDVAGTAVVDGIA